MSSQTIETKSYAAFRGHRRVAAGPLKDVATEVHRLANRGDSSLVLLFDESDGRQLDIDLSGTASVVAARFAGESPPAADTRRGPGRPRLGVVGHEVTLLPRHWEWLRGQRGGPSATLRRLVDEARSANREHDRVRQAQDAINRFISAVAGDLPGFEEATRALYRGEREHFDAEIAQWPGDVRKQLEHWKAAAFDN